MIAGMPVIGTPTGKKKMMMMAGGGGAGHQRPPDLAAARVWRGRSP